MDTEMRRKSMAEAACPIARSLDTIGEWWSLLIVRDAMVGVRRFSDFQRRLGMARNILSARLKRLVECGILDMVPASDGTAYKEYVLTEKGKSLWPVLYAMRQWGEQYLYEPGEERTQLLDKRHRKSLARMQVQGANGESLRFDDVDLVRVKVTRGGGFKPVRHRIALTRWPGWSTG
jgi:DNA-binding HxlR family transcriptional regulator